MVYNKDRKIAKYVVFAAIGITLGAGIIGYPKVASFIDRIQQEEANEDTMAQILEEQVLETTIRNFTKKEEEEVVILENAFIEVPFVCQAPFQTEANWVFHEESCEEAALIQVKYYLDGVTEVDPQKAHNTILDMIKWEENAFGSHIDLYANDMKKFITGYYNLEDDQVEIIYDASILDIKKEISKGNPIIAPIMGDILKNPYYPYPGYHMLTITGYTPEKIITNDVGTKRGENYSYDYDIFMKALKAGGGDILIMKKN